ncbi:MAG: pfkB family carbohydrate kinase [Firmicutes bacterium ADurb.Bin300]|nr:MAG: pfkB family carbohydrate kinase [Firmicutes bacterium ADurb.Bin300]
MEKTKKYSSVIIGHISLDRNIDFDGKSVETLGGAVLFSSASAYALGHNVLAVTKLAAGDFSRLEAFSIPKENVIALTGVSSTSIQNQYLSEDKERRNCTCLSRGTPFSACDIPNVQADIYHFAGLIFGDFDDETIKLCAKKGAAALDVQACLRHADMENGTMYFKDWAQKEEILPLITYLKLDAAEAEIMTGTQDRRQAAKLLYSLGAKEILITHNTEVLAYDGKRFYSCPIKSRNLSGRTGRGDTTFAAYINERLNNDIPDSLLWATASVSLKMETPGPLKATRKDIEDYITLFY